MKTEVLEFNASAKTLPKHLFRLHEHFFERVRLMPLFTTYKGEHFVWRRMIYDDCERRVSVQYLSTKGHSMIYTDSRIMYCVARRKFPESVAMYTCSIILLY